MGTKECLIDQFMHKTAMDAENLERLFITAFAAD